MNEEFFSHKVQDVKSFLHHFLSRFSHVDDEKHAIDEEYTSSIPVRKQNQHINKQAFQDRVDRENGERDISAI